MRNTYIRILFTLIIIGFSSQLNAENRRVIPLDMYLIVDGSESFQNSKNDAVTWINSQVVDRTLMDGDRITIWRAGNSAQIIYSGDVSGGKDDIKNALNSLLTDARTPDFSGALTEAASRVSRTPQDRLSYTMLVTASAEGLEQTLTGGARNLLRWFRSEKYERWQVLVVGPDITPRVRQAAASLLDALR